MSWIHIGDLHASDEDGWESIARLERIIDEVRDGVPTGTLDFAYLPGDNANHGERAQYRRIVDALRALPLPVYAIPGDHDFEPGSLDAFRRLAPGDLPLMERFDGRRALFLDVVSAGSGGPDFRLGDRQLAWLRTHLAASKAGNEPHPVVFMHAFPSDLEDGADAVAHLLAEAPVALVDTGHTHYNELQNDGHVIYAATRSTGQVEEGAFGYSISAIDGDTPSWRFREAGTPWPWVLITAPADCRMATAAVDPDRSAVRALVLGPDVARVEVSIDGGPRMSMRPVDDRPGRWSLAFDPPFDATRLSVIATDSRGHEAADHLQLKHDERSAGPWTDHGVLGTRLGPNANGRAW
jgi:Icc protein